MLPAYSQTSHHFLLVCWHLSVATFFGPDTFISFEKRWSSLWWRRENVSGHWRLELPVGNVSFFSLNTERGQDHSTASREVCLASSWTHSMWRQWREGELEGLFFVGESRFTRSLPDSRQKKEMELNSHPSWFQPTKHCSQQLQLSNCFQHRCFPSFRYSCCWGWTITACFLYFRKVCGGQDSHCI